MTGRDARIVRTIAFTGVIIAFIVLVLLAVHFFDASGKGGNKLGSAFDYNPRDLRKIAPEQVGYRLVRMIETTPGPRAIALDANGRLLIGGEGGISFYSPDGDDNAAEAISMPGPVTALATADDGTIYVALRGHIRMISPGGAFEDWPAPADECNITGLAISGADVFAADAAGRVVWRYDTSGELLGEIGRRDGGRNIAGFVIPSPYFDLAMAPDGLLRVANPGRRRVEAYTSRGDLEFFWGVGGAEVEAFVGCCNPAALAILPDGRLVTAEKGQLPTVKVFHSDSGPRQGELQTVVAPPGDSPLGFTGGLDLAVGPGGRVYVLDGAAGEIRIYLPIPEDATDE